MKDTLSPIREKSPPCMIVIALQFLNTTISIDIFVRKLLQDCHIFEPKNRLCLIYTDDINYMCIFPNLHEEWKIQERLHISKCKTIDISSLYLPDMVLISSIPKKDFYKQDKYGLMQEDYSIKDIIEREFVKETSRELVHILPKIDDPVICCAVDFVKNLGYEDKRLIGMVKYMATIVGEYIYENIPEVRCTRLEMESYMMYLSKELHIRFILDVCNIWLLNLEQTHSSKSRAFSELAIGSLIYEQYVSKYVAVMESKSVNLWRFYDGIWKEISPSRLWKDLSYTLQGYIKKSQYDLKDISRYIGSVSARERIQKDIITRLIDDRFLTKLNSSRYLIGMENGIYDINTGELREALPMDYVSMSTGNKLGISNKYSRKYLINLLSQIFPNKNILRYFIRSCAMLLEGQNKNKVVYIWWGRGNNGKSMVETLLSKALGDYITVAATSLVTSKRTVSDNATPQLASLEGRLGVFLQEPNPNEVIRIGMVKELSGGDKITARALYRSPKVFTPKFKLILVCNSILDIPSADTAFKNRLVVIPFVSTFHTKENYTRLKNPSKKDFIMDTTINRDIGDLASTFLDMLVDEYNKIKDKDLIAELPDEIKEATNKYLNRSNTVLSFIKDILIEDKTSSVPKLDIYQEYRKYVNSNMSRRPKDSIEFFEELTYQGYIIKDNYVVGTRCLSLDFGY